MKSLKVWTNVPNDFEMAEKAAREEVRKVLASPNLVAFYDRERDIAGPSEACSEEGRGCPSQYAKSHGALFEVSVNNHGYEFYYVDTPSGTQVLDAAQVIAIHRDLVQNRFDNIQGG